MIFSIDRTQDCVRTTALLEAITTDATEAVAKLDTETRVSEGFYLCETTGYFKNSVLSRRPYLNKEWLEFVVENPERIEVQPNGRTRYWAFISEAGKYLRVVVDGVTIHNAFFDRGFKK